MSMISTCFSTFSILPLSFLLIGASATTSCSKVSFLADDLVKGLLALVSTAAVGEGKSNFLPILSMVLAEGIFSSSGAGWGENSLYGE